MESYILILLILAVIWYWWSSFSAYDVAYQAARNSCAKLDLQFLDDTLDVIKVRPCRHARGFIQLCRLYEFEFSSDGDNRYTGYVALSGSTFENIDLGAYKSV